MDAAEINTTDNSHDDGSVVSMVEICRVCLSDNLVMRDLFPTNDVASLSAKAMSFANVKILPDDGLPRRICCLCAEKLESAYEFKLQVEQADAILRERFLTINMKEELFFNEVEVHVKSEGAEQQDGTHVETHYQTIADTLSSAMTNTDDSCITMKDHDVALVSIERLNEEATVTMATTAMTLVTAATITAGSTTDTTSIAHAAVAIPTTTADTATIVATAATTITTSTTTNVATTSAAATVAASTTTSTTSATNNNATTSMVVEEMAQDAVTAEQESGWIESNDDRNDIEEMDFEETEIVCTEASAKECLDEPTEVMCKDEGLLKCETVSGDFGSATIEHDYILQETYGLSSDERRFDSDDHECSMVKAESECCPAPSEKKRADDAKAGDAPITEVPQIIRGISDDSEKEQSVNLEWAAPSMKRRAVAEVAAPSHTETRRSKRRVLLRKHCATDRDSDEENYFENLNLSSRLKRAQAERNDRVLFACYLCDKQFLSKDVLKEHMHSHEEVRKTLSLKRTLERTPKEPDDAPDKMPPSGRKANKCSYCGKEYLYIISFNKHLKQHERDEQEVEDSDNDMPTQFEDSSNENGRTWNCRKRKTNDREADSSDAERGEELEEEGEMEPLEDHEDAENVIREAVCEAVCEPSGEPASEVVEEEQGDQDAAEPRDNRTENEHNTCETAGVYEVESVELDAESRANVDKTGTVRRGRRAAGQTCKKNGSTDIADVAERELEGRGKNSRHRRKRVRTVDFGITCEKCSEQFRTRKDLREHAITHVSLKCSVCTEQFESLEKLRNHRTRHVLEGVLTEQDLEGNFCKLAEYLDIGKRALGSSDEQQSIEKTGRNDRHEDVEYSENENGEISTKTGIDSSDRVENLPAATGPRSARRHPTGDGDTEVDTDADGGYSCKLCCERFSSKNRLQKHTEQHNRIRSYKCTQCNKLFTNELALRNHLIASSHKTFLHGQEYDPDKRIKRVAARAAQRIIDKIRTEAGLADFDEDSDENSDGGIGGGIDSDADLGTYGRRREVSQQKRSYPRRDHLVCTNCNRKCNSKQALAKHTEQCQHAKEQKSVKSEKARKNTNGKENRTSMTSTSTTSTTTSTTNMTRNISSDCGDIGGGSLSVSPVGIGGNSRNGSANNFLVGSNAGTTSGFGLRVVPDEPDDDSDFESGLDWPMDNHECKTCKKRYSTKKSLLRHQLLHEEPNFECDICRVKFYRKDKLKAHYDKCSEKNPDQVRKCNICGDSFENNQILRKHRSKHVTEGILTEEDLRDTEPRPEEKRQGERIGRKRRTDIVGLECTECNKRYTSRKGLLRHIQVHEGKKYLCDICPKKFYRREHLKIHVAKHNMIKPYKCTRCTKRFIKEEQLTSHLSKHDRAFRKSKETDSTKRFLCEICSKSFTQSTTLIAHLRAHNGIKPYVCEVCSRPFTTNAYLKMHMRTHTQERPYICQYCSRAFARADTLANHLTSHTGEAKYHCKYCPKNFRRLKSLKEHVFIHTGQRPYACPTCDRRFNNNGSRYAHTKRCKQNFVQNQNRAAQGIATATVQSIPPHHTQQRLPPQTVIPQGSHRDSYNPTGQPPSAQTISTTPGQIVKTQNIKTITITRPSDSVAVSAQQVMQHQEILMPLILPLTVTLTDVGEEVILPEGTKIFTTT